MTTRAKNALVLAAFAVVAFGALFAVWRVRQRPDIRQGALDAVPNGALLVATADLGALRASAVGGRFLREGREIPGLGKVRDVCGFDPLDVLTEVAIAVPAAGDSGDFGIVGAGPVDHEALLACAAKVIEARGGRAVVTNLGTFRTVRDADLPTAGGEIAVRPGGPVLLGGGAYLRAMIDTADGRGPSVRASSGHGHLAGAVGEGALRLTVVLTPEQRRTLVEELRDSGGDAAAAALVAGAATMQLGAAVKLHGVLACENPRACAELAKLLDTARTERAADLGTRVIGVSAALDRLEITAEGELVHLRLELPIEDATRLVDRVLTLRSFRHPTAPEPPAQAPETTDGGAPVPDEVVRRDGG